jgi:hypothetical protein
MACGSGLARGGLLAPFHLLTHELSTGMGVTSASGRARISADRTIYGLPLTVARLSQMAASSVISRRSGQAWRWFVLTGTLLERFGRRGNYDGQFEMAHAIAMARDGSLYVADITGKRMQKFVRNTK